MIGSAFGGSFAHKMAAAAPTPGDGHEPVYHEQQRSQMCGLHAINSLLQEKAFSKADFYRICDELSPPPEGFLARLFTRNPHRSNWLHTGDFDVNVLIRALTERGHATRWFDARHRIVERFPVREVDALVGFLVNERSSSLLGGLTGSRHWFAVRCVHGRWLNLDSNLDLPEPIDGGLAGVFDLLQGMLDGGGQVIEVWRGDILAARRASALAALPAGAATAGDRDLDLYIPAYLSSPTAAGGAGASREVSGSGPAAGARAPSASADE